MLEQSWKKVYLRTKTNQFHCYNQNMGFVNSINKSVPNYNIGIRMKKWWWSAFVSMVDVVLQGAWILYCVNKDEGDESLPFLVFRRHIVNAIFLKYSKEGILSSSYVGIRNIPWDICYDDTKHYQVQSEHRRTQNPFKHLRWSVLCKQSTPESC